MPKQNAVNAVCVELHALRSDVCDHHVFSELCSEAFTALRVMNGLPALLISLHLSDHVKCDVVFQDHFFVEIKFCLNRFIV